MPRTFLRRRLANSRSTLVADIMAVGVVDRLEAVEVGDHQRQRPPPRDGPVEQGLQMAVEVAAVVQAGQAVGHRHLDGLRDACPQLVVVALAPDLGAQPGGQLLLVDRPDEDSR